MDKLIKDFQKLNYKIPDLPNTNRKLASIQIINEIKTHQNAEKLELAKVLGWQVVINKEQLLKTNDKVIYFEIDSILPKEEWSKFMEKCKYRVKTIKLRGELSQGLIIPIINIFPKLDREFNEGEDLTEFLKITKHEEEEIEKNGNQSSVKISSFPTNFGIEKTDEPRIQSNPKILDSFLGNPYIATLKYDGTSSTFIYDEKNSEFIVCSRNNKIDKNEVDLYWKTAINYKIEEILKTNPDFILQGEIYGPKINNNYLGVKNVKLVIFNVYSISKQKGIDYQEMVEFCKNNKLDYAELMLSGDKFDETITSLLEKVKGNYPNTTFPREGYVFRLKNDWDIKNKRSSFKVINNDFLLKKDK